MKPATEDFHIEVDLSKYDPDYLDDIRDPARAARGLFYGMMLSVPFWLLIIVVVALVKSCTGGG